jgi:Tfp pilus assembly protein PilX
MVTTMESMELPARGRAGYALLLVLLLVLAVGILAAGAVAVVGNAGLINAYEARRTELESLADAGVEVARARLNDDRTLYPTDGYATLENGVAVTDAAGAAIPGVRRWTYAGPVGQTSGQYGVFGSIVSVVQAGNAKVVRRGDVAQESFAKYAYFTDVEPSNIAFGGGDVISGPVHSNDDIQIYSSRATFRGPGSVTTAGVINGKQYGTFTDGYTERAAVIPLPTLADLGRLRGYAQSGGTDFNASPGGGQLEARMRIEFMTIELNDNGRVDEDEGFFRVWEANGSIDYLMGRQGGLGWEASENCGWYDNANVFRAIKDTPGTATERRDKLRTARARCYLGGSDSLFNGQFVASIPGRGEWRRRGFGLAGAIPARLAARQDLDYLYPLSRNLNPNFKGVIHVTGRVAVSGALRGRVTLAATDRILIADDVVYAGEGSGCDDILGLFGGADIVVVDNLLNTPQKLTNANNETWRSFDSTPSEFINAVVLTLSTFTVQGFDAAPVNGEMCEAAFFGRGCLFLTGGIIQRTRGAVGTSGGTGYLKRYTYDACAYTDPPPYFPTTGHFARTRWYEVNPVGFTPGDFYDRMTPD